MKSYNARSNKKPEDKQKSFLEISGSKGSVLNPPVYGIDAVDSNLALPSNPEMLSGKGQPLESSTRTEMETRFGEDFSSVRVHKDANAAKAAEVLHAKAYTVGHNVVFGTGQYSPQTSDGKRLVAHELTHVVQQSRGQSSVNSAPISQPSEPSEKEAEQISADVASHQVNVKQSAHEGQIQRFGWDDIKKHLPGYKEKTNSDSENGTENAKTAIERTNQAFDVAQSVLKKFRNNALSSGSSEKLKQVDKMIDNLETAHKHFKDGAEVVEKSIKAVEVLNDVDQFTEAVERLNSIDDVRANDETRAQAAKAYDDVFSSFGTLGKHLPKGPWSSWFDFLENFNKNGGFFSNMTEAIGRSARKADEIANDRN